LSTCLYNCQLFVITAYRVCVSSFLYLVCLVRVFVYIFVFCFFFFIFVFCFFVFFFFQAEDGIRDSSVTGVQTCALPILVKAVAEATREADIRIMFLIDASGSMQGAIETSKEALSMIVQGFPPEKLHIASFNTVGTQLKPRQHSAAGVEHMLKGIGASGGTIYSSAVNVFVKNGVRIPANADLILFAVGDEAGEEGSL